MATSPGDGGKVGGFSGGAGLIGPNVQAARSRQAAASVRMATVSEI